MRETAYTIGRRSRNVYINLAIVNRPDFFLEPQSHHFRADLLANNQLSRCPTSLKMTTVGSSMRMIATSLKSDLTSCRVVSRHLTEIECRINRPLAPLHHARDIANSRCHKPCSTRSHQLQPQ